MSKRRGEARETELVEMFRALSHPNRFRLFMEILNANEAAFEEGQLVVFEGARRPVAPSNAIRPGPAPHPPGSAGPAAPRRCFIHTLMRQLNVGAPTVSHHLKELVRADLVSTQKQGKYVTCQVNEDALAKIASFFARTVLSEGAAPPRPSECDSAGPHSGSSLGFAEPVPRRGTA